MRFEHFFVAVVSVLSGTLSVQAASPQEPPRPPAADVVQPSASRQVIPLWPEGVPGGRPAPSPEVVKDGLTTNVHVPTLTAYPAPADRATGTAVIVCPGGAYELLSMDDEGHEPARWLNSLGVSAFVLKYRLKEYGQPAPLQDVLRAVRLVRANAAKWKVAPGKIGVMGFSAGGHLAATAGTLFDAPEGRTGAALDATSARPDFLVLVYPVITMELPVTHRVSRQRLLGADPSNALVERFSPDRQVTPRTPPAFIVHSTRDTEVSVENSVMFYAALHAAAIPGELHLYQDGQHGIGLRPGYGTFSNWPAQCVEWMKARGLVPRG